MKPQKPKVLIVDDEPRNVRLLEAIVSPMGVEVYTAFNGTQALEMVTSVSPDVILLDIVMPGMDGIEVCRQLKGNSKTRNIPVVFVTALADVQNHAAAVEAGGIGFVTKPVQDILVEASVKNAIRMKQLSDEVEELMRHRASLTGMIVHDMNNLLSVILGYAAFLLSDHTLPESVRNDIVAIEKSGNDIRSMTITLLEVEKLESGTMPISPKELNVWDLAKQRAELLVSEAVERGIRLEFNAPEKDVIVFADQALLSRILDNLIFNAVKFSPDRGNIELGASSEDGMGRISVTNDGPPIPKEYHEKIFEKFAQVEIRKTTGRKGVGLGLAFCKMAVEAMNGKISVESPLPEREDGVRFNLHFPTALKNSE